MHSLSTPQPLEPTRPLQEHPPSRLESERDWREAGIAGECPMHSGEYVVGKAAHSRLGRRHADFVATYYPDVRLRAEDGMGYTVPGLHIRPRPMQRYPDHVPVMTR